jgi:DNA modification methylase
MDVPLLNPAPNIASKFSKDETIIAHHGDTERFLKTLPSSFVGLVITSPPYNLGKEYESRVDIGSYLSTQSGVITELIRVLSDTGSLCWQVGN